ncbi:hypothetical protein [Bradyrhizobium brasilense]|uniref:hypothetical protein n=1 Tax=Bradyrhizobium brasilense TaxID=1419277 RepID=UPI001E373216|nr:hypothetical protein [Bradyrhizobium brasilense]MCC8977093.1 hypothetical protein [Bradyrhizobium brasilense]
MPQLRNLPRQELRLFLCEQVLSGLRHPGEGAALVDRLEPAALDRKLQSRRVLSRCRLVPMQERTIQLLDYDGRGTGAVKKMTEDRPYADAEKAARRLMEHARAFEPIQDGRIYNAA